MKIKDLMRKLQDLDENLEVIISVDAEGNEFRSVLCISADMNYRDGEIGFSRLSETDKSEGYTEEDVMTDGVPVVVIWPY